MPDGIPPVAGCSLPRNFEMLMSKKKDKARQLYRELVAWARVKYPNLIEEKK